MRPTRLRTAGILTVTLTLTSATFSTARAQERDYSAISELVDAELRKDGIGGASLAIVDGGKIVYERGFGFADMEAGIEAGPEHVYRIGSVTKQFTGYALLKLVHEKRLKLSDPVERLVPEVARIQHRYLEAPPPTLLQLATMTSGLAREPEDLATYLVGPADDWLGVVLRALPSVRYDFPPDDRYQYSNIGYAILGAVIDRSVETSYMEYVREEMLEPLGMSDSDFVPRPRFGDRIAKGYRVVDGEVDSQTPAREHQGRGYKVPNGALYSTVTDLARFLGFQMGEGPEEVLPKDVLASNFERVNSADGTLSFGYGIGFMLRRRGELAIIGHSGSVAGYRAGCYFDPQSRKGVVLLRNVTGGAFDLTELALRILEDVADDS